MLLTLWLKEVPDYTVLFARLVIINAFIDSTAHPLMTAIQATGRIRAFQMVTAGLLILNLPVSYIFLKLGYPPQITMIVSICISVIAQLSRLAFAKKLVGLGIVYYCREVLWPIGLVTICSFVLPLLLAIVIENKLTEFIIVSIVSVLSVGLFVFVLGMSKDERSYLFGFVKSKIHRKDENNK